MKRRTFFAAATVAAFIGAPSFAQDMDVLDTAAAQADTSAFIAAVESTPLAETLRTQPGPFTLYVPTNEAIAAAGGLDGMSEDQLMSLISYHIVNENVVTVAMMRNAPDPKIPAVEGDDVAVKTDMGGIDGTHVLFGDIPASNGIVHVVDKVIMPPA